MLFAILCQVWRVVLALLGGVAYISKKMSFGRATVAFVAADMVMLGVFVGAVPSFAVESHDIGGAVLVVTGTTYEKFVKTGLITTDDSTRVLFGDHLTAKAVCSAGADNEYVVKNGLNLSIEIFDTETYYIKSKLLHNYSGTSTNGTLRLKEPTWTENQFIRVVCDTATESILLMLLERKLVKSHFLWYWNLYHRTCAADGQRGNHML